LTNYGFSYKTAAAGNNYFTQRNHGFTHRRIGKADDTSDTGFIDFVAVLWRRKTEQRAADPPVICLDLEGDDQPVGQLVLSSISAISHGGNESSFKFSGNFWGPDHKDLLNQHLFIRDDSHGWVNVEGEIDFEKKSGSLYIWQVGISKKKD